MANFSDKIFRCRQKFRLTLVKISVEQRFLCRLGYCMVGTHLRLEQRVKLNNTINLMGDQ